MLVARSANAISQMAANVFGIGHSPSEAREVRGDRTDHQLIEYRPLHLCVHSISQNVVNPLDQPVLLA